jgi:hypothetical protein
VTGRAEVSISPPLSLSRSSFGRTRLGFDFLALLFGGEFEVGGCFVAFAMAEASLEVVAGIELLNLLLI